LVPGLFVVLLAAVGEMGFTAFREVANVPIRHVSVNGDFRFIDRARIEESMLPHLGTGYFMVDLARIRNELQRLPLVHEVTVRRAWPDRLLVYITEQVPVLRFGEDAYLNPYAEVFRVLTADKAGATPDIASIAARVSSLAPFESFMSGYRQRLAGPAKPATG
jgi:cell division protein FtsQ